MTKNQPPYEDPSRIGTVVRTVNRPSPSVVDSFRDLSVATVHEAQGRVGLLDPALRPIYPGAFLHGTAVTVSVPPADNWMVHVALELCKPGDVLMVAPTSPSDAGYFGELLATAAAARGVRGLVIDAGCRDIAALSRLGFPVWARHISARGTVKETLGTVNIPIVCSGQLVTPGDVIVADDDGVVVVAAEFAESVAEQSRARDSKEAASRARYASGELSLDVSSMRERLAERGLRYVD